MKVDRFHGGWEERIEITGARQFRRFDTNVGRI